MKLVAALIVAVSVFYLVAALALTLALSVALGVYLFTRARSIDRSFTEILRKQEQSRLLLTSNRSHPVPRPEGG